MTAPCFRLDDYLDGRLSEADAEAFETHTLSCSTCDAALDEAALDLSTLRDVTCPPEVVEAALRAARRAPTLAPDRSPAVRQRFRRRFSVVPLALIAAVAIAVGVSWDRGGTDPAEPIAEAVVPTDAPEPPPSEAALSDPTVPASDTTVEAPPLPSTPEPAPRLAQAPRPSPTPPAPEPTAPPSDDLVAQADPTPEASGPEPTPEEIEAAREDLELAFHLVADAQTQARAAVRAEATPLSHTIDRALPF